MHELFVCATYCVYWRDEMTLTGGSSLLLLAAGGSRHRPVRLWLSESPVVPSLHLWYPPQPSSVTSIRWHNRSKNSSVKLLFSLSHSEAIFMDGVIYLTWLGSASASSCSSFFSSSSSSCSGWRFGHSLSSSLQFWAVVSAEVEVVPLRLERQAAEFKKTRPSNCLARRLSGNPSSAV